jgi:hypothetical protein
MEMLREELMQGTARWVLLFDAHISLIPDVQPLSYFIPSL